MICRLIESQQMVLEDPSRRFLKECLIMGKYLNAVNDENKQILIDVHSIVGYCHYEGHPGLLTVTDYKSHHCFGKKCPLLQPYKSFPYWDKHKNEYYVFSSDCNHDEYIKREKERKAVEKRKKQRVIEQQRKLEIETAQREKHIEKLKLYIELLFGETSSYQFHVAKIEYLGKNRYKVFMVTDYDEYYDLSFLTYLIPALKKSYEGRYTFVRMKSPYGEFATKYEWDHRKKLR